MRICFITHDFPPDTAGGGIGTYTRDLAEVLSGRGCDVSVVTASSSGRREYAENGYRVVRIPRLTPAERLASLASAGLSVRLAYARRVAREVWRLERSAGRFDVVEAPNFRGEGYFYSRRPGGVFGTRLSTPSREYGRLGGGAVADRIKRLHWGLRDRLECAQIERSDYVISNSRANGQLVGAYCRSRPPREVVVIAHGIRVDAGPPPRRARQDRYILCVTKFEPRKGVEHLVRAFEEIAQAHADVTLVIVGRDTRRWGLFGSHRARCMAGVGAAARRRIEILDFVEEEELEALYAGCELFVAPSLYESFGLVFLEAMRHARPVVGCRAGGVPEVVEDGVTGILVAPGSPRDLAEAVGSLLSDPGAGRAMGEAGRRRLEELFDRERMASESLEFYEQMVAMHGRPS